jgi:hypothetical protein
MTRSPTAGAHRQRTKSFTLTRQSGSIAAGSLAQGFCCVSLQAQFKAFVHVAVESSTRLRSNRPAFWNLSIGGLLVAGPYPLRLAGPATLDRSVGRNVVSPREYSKGYFYVPMGHYRGILRAPTARPMPARSALGGPGSVNPAVVIIASIWLAWPCPASTTRTASAARRPAACAIRTR